MPRDGSGIYTQPFPDVISGTTIESAKYNGNVDDVEQDLNTPRPIVAGGTGANSAADARFNLEAEGAAQAVTSYDSHTWYPGSFRSAVGAAGAPVAGHAFAGWCYIGEALANPPTNQNVVVHAYDLDALAGTHLLYSRQKKAGVWGSWSITTTESNQTGARQAIYAAPFDAMAYNGIQVNGAMGVSQENGLDAVVVPSALPKHIVDGWYCYKSFATAITAKQNTGGVIGNGFYRAVMSVAATAPAPMAAGDYFFVGHKIEGMRVARLGWGSSVARPVTVSFWIISTVAGHASLTANNVSATRSYTTDVFISVPNEWQYKTVTIPGDTAGSWAKDNTAGITLQWTLVCGTASQTAGGAWVGSNYIATTAQTNLFNAINNQVSITGVTVFAGTEGPTAERSSLVIRPADQELITCQRYFQRSDLSIPIGYQGVGDQNIVIPFTVTMRAAPTVTIIPTTGSFTAAAAPAAGHWGLVKANVVWATINTGSWISVALSNSDTRSASIQMRGGPITLSVSPDVFMWGGPDAPFLFEARL